MRERAGETLRLIPDDAGQDPSSERRQWESHRPGLGQRLGGVLSGEEGSWGGRRRRRGELGRGMCEEMGVGRQKSSRVESVNGEVRNDDDDGGDDKERCRG